ncbi:hypothetical protein [Cohnella abietis]|uniref:Uncharacterized protein n=1 Tax=Cohnella abietis TaxID=2507935 RepID=A0A3T1D2V1_9BACL|nr:hypothetical protein [Cohnella abietis]BBI32371.1 hypothetical protein KCTCHS21_17700 [Cohnella abietis]
MMTIVRNGVTKAAPPHSLYEAILNPQQKSAERNGNGRLNRETLPDKWSINQEWEFATPQEFYDWFNYLKSLTRIDFTANFPAPTGRIETAIFYVAPISAKMINYSRGAGGWWKTLKCNFVEV